MLEINLALIKEKNCMTNWTLVWHREDICRILSTALLVLLKPTHGIPVVLTLAFLWDGAVSCAELQSGFVMPVNIHRGCSHCFHCTQVSSPKIKSFNLLSSLPWWGIYSNVPWIRVRNKKCQKHSISHLSSHVRSLFLLC